MKLINCILIGLVLSACTSGVDTPTNNGTKAPSTTDPGNQMSEAEKLIEPKKTIADKKSFPNGLRIQWFEKGTGEAVKDGSVYEINFKTRLKTGEIIDGNYKLQRDMLPYLVGYGMQTPGFDIAMKELHVGDFVEIFIPGQLARGEKGIPGIVPPNSPNIVFLRIGKEIPPTKVVDGVRVWKLEENPEIKDAGITATSNVAIHYFVGTKSNPRYDNSYQRNTPFAFGMKDASLIPGLRKAMINAKMYDKLYILVPASEAYGSKGYVDLVKPNEDLFYDVIVMDVDGKSVQK
ncbi:FKBP-type peptidyl-prolyl cis-trans isomerase [Fluviicola taffensis]|uniref:Peptidyl-prolyl cis-trans isomerase n=1 Tax=Fluviicola taffensis (strain DSM 16823 / NCIMB 13979 / RW262) TaxID=755732 RepID=F2IAB2_FLUTR|nr:FKBP-type peptidyl-prolyl cis-trans isomerase [Fluviicola taffensis]AEA42047.1 peptidylprolyl isomerase FKBP-type [Fluviicola taffensis DSM 16823]